MSTHGDGGKGSGRRKEDVKKVHDNWDLIFKKKDKQAMDEHDHEDGEWTCDVCGGPMYRQAHRNYAQCDDCGERQELIDDDYL